FLSVESGTAAAVAKAFALLVIPFSLVGPATGVVIDRWSRRRILAVTPLVRAAAALGLLLAAGQVCNVLCKHPNGRGANPRVGRVSLPSHSAVKLAAESDAPE